MNANLPTASAGAENQNSRNPFSILNDLEPETEAALHRVARRVELKPGELLLSEGELSNEFYVVKEGAVELFRAGREGGQDRHITDVTTGGLLGELALVDGGSRSLSARAKGDCKLLMVSPDDILALPEGKRLITDLKASLGISIVQRMRGATDNYVEVLERELEAVRTQQHFGHFFVYVLTIMAIGALVNYVISRHLITVDVYSQQFAWMYAAILLIPALVVIWGMEVPLSDMGLTRIELGRSLKEGVLASLAVILLTVLVAGALYLLDKLPKMPLQFELYPTIGYAIHSFLQELIGRGLMQNSFQRFFNDRKGIKSVLLASILFGIFHLHFGLMAVLLTMISGFIFGAFFLRTGNVAGVSLLHFTAGACAFGSGLL